MKIGGFMAVRCPERLVTEFVRCGRRDLTVIANDSARPGIGIGKLITQKCVRRPIVSHIGTSPETQRQMFTGDLKVELVPQGTLAERIRAGGVGLGGVITRTGVGTLAAEVKRGGLAAITSNLPDSDRRRIETVEQCSDERTHPCRDLLSPRWSLRSAHGHDGAGDQTTAYRLRAPGRRRPCGSVRRQLAHK